MSCAFLSILLLTSDLSAALTVNTVDALETVIDRTNADPNANRTILISALAFEIVRSP